MSTTASAPGDERRRARVSPVAAATAVVLVVLGYASTTWQPSGVALSARPRRVVIFGLDHFDLADMETAAPNLTRIASRGAVAITSIRTLAYRSTTSAGYASLGAGVRVATDAQSPAADDQGTGVRATDVQHTRHLVAGLHLSSLPGALGDALHAAKASTAAVGNADAPGSQSITAPAVDRPAALAAMDHRGVVDAGAVDPGAVLITDASAPFGVRADEDKVFAAVTEALGRARVVVVDPGDLDRAQAAAGTESAGAAAAARRDALRRTDALLGRIDGALPRDTLLIATSMSRAPGQSFLGPTVVAGAGVPHGYLVSPSTKRLGVIAITDLAPTVLAALGLHPPAGMIGHPLRYHAGAVSARYLRGLDSGTTTREQVYLPVTEGFIAAQIVVYGLALWHRRSRLLAATLRPLALGLVAFPLASFVVRLDPWPATGATSVALMVGLDILVVALVSRLQPRVFVGLAWILGATVATLVVDTALGAHLEVSSWLGYSLYSAGRFYGVPNTSYAVLAAATLMLATLLVDGWDHGAARAAVPRLAVPAAVFVVVTVVLGAPTLGANVGAILTLVPVFVCTVLIWSGRRLGWRTLALVGGATALALAAGAVADLLRPAASRTHMGTFVTTVHGHGVRVLLTTIARKELANLRIARSSQWTWMVVVGVAASAWLLRSSERRRALLPPGSALRVGAMAGLALAVVGLGTSDSGPVFVALVFAYVGPVLLLRELAPADLRGSGSVSRRAGR